MNNTQKESLMSLLVKRCLAVLVTMLFSLASGTSWAGDDQIGDFRIGSTVYPDYTSVETWSDSSRGALDVLNDPNLPGISSTFSGLSQNADMILDPDPNVSSAPGTDTQLRTFSANTHIRTINRFASDPDGPGGATGPQRSGAVQWSFDLTPIDNYLSSKGLDLTALDLDFVTTTSDATKNYDVILSYTNAAESITLANIDTTITLDADTGGARENYNNVWLPLHDTNANVIPGDFDGNLTVEAADLALWETGYGTDSGATIGDGDADNDGDVDGLDFLTWQQNLGSSFGGLPGEGDIYGGSYLVVGKDRTGPQSINESLLGLYNDGVRQFNLIVQSGDFFSGRLIRIENGSGLSITTVPIPLVTAVPEPTSLTLIGILGLLKVCGRRKRS